MVVETLTEHWLNSRLPFTPTKRKVANCKQGVKHVMEFINEMASDEPKPTVCLTYIDDLEKIKR